ncbi:ATP synthase F1 subunit delta [Balneolales bacterium ANBcel1]|nr:ATP synthase F1 subunit delta [Balneolales bacterium ANBcel1]
MIVTKVAKRYASALFQEAKEQEALDAVSEDMKQVYSTISASSELRLFLKSHIISRKVKRDALDKLFGDNMHQITRQFIRLILEKRREDQLFGAAAAFGKLHRDDQGLLEVTVYMVTKPDDKQGQRLKKALEKRTGKTLSLNYIEDPSLIGGVAVRINDTVIDGTIKHKLQQLEGTFQ